MQTSWSYNAMAFVNLNGDLYEINNQMRMEYGSLLLSHKAERERGFGQRQKPVDVSCCEFRVMGCYDVPNSLQTVDQTMVIAAAAAGGGKQCRVEAWMSNGELE